MRSSVRMSAVKVMEMMCKKESSNIRIASIMMTPPCALRVLSVTCVRVFFQSFRSHCCKTRRRACVAAKTYRVPPIVSMNEQGMSAACAETLQPKSAGRKMQSSSGKTVSVSMSVSAHVRACAPVENDCASECVRVRACSSGCVRACEYQTVTYLVYALEDPRQEGARAQPSALL